jgi:hypothetical protein
MCQHFGKKRKVKRNEHVESTAELETKKVYIYLGIEENHNIEHKKKNKD